MGRLESIQEVVDLRRWRVTEVVTNEGKRSRHLWGHDVINSSGRSSSAIVTFDSRTMTVTTRSGSTYRLLGLPGNSRIGRHAWHNWCKENNVVFKLDVTSEYLDVEQLSTAELTKFTGVAPIANSL